MENYDTVTEDDSEHYEYDSAGCWICVCGRWIEDGFHCPNCRDEWDDDDFYEDYYPGPWDE